MSANHGPNIITDGLMLYLDAANVKSYPTTGTTWTDLSGNRLNGALTNGPIFSSANNGGIVFDGTNDATLLPASALWNVGTSNFTIEFWFKRTGTSQTYGRYFQLTNGDTFSAFSLAVKGTNQDQLSFSMTSANGSWNVLSDATIGTLVNDQYNHIVISRIGTNFYLYLNGVQSTIATSSASLYYASGGVPIIGGQTVGTARSIAGVIPVFRFYIGKGLTFAEALQNYNALKTRFTSNVNISLLLYLDAGNITSYPGSGTTWYDISGNNNNGTLTNTTFNSSNGGNLVFNGSNSSFTTAAFKTLTSGNNINNDTTNEIWYKWNGVSQLVAITYVGAGGSTGYLSFTINNGSGASGNVATVTYGGQFISAIDTGTSFATLTSGVWTQLVITKTPTICKFYQNGVFLGSTTRTQSTYTTTSPYQSATFGGSLAIAKLYNGALSDSDILQNYNATKSRFGL